MNAIEVKRAMIEVHVPQLFPTLSTRDTLTIEKWYVRENDIVQPGDLLLSIETPPGFYDIPTPPDVDVPHRVACISIPQGEPVRLGDLLIMLEPISEG